MKRKNLALRMALPILTATLTLSACHTMPNTTTTHPTAAVTLPLTNAMLQRYDWQLISVTNAAGNQAQQKLFVNGNPLIVKFSPDGQMRFVNTCNRMWGSYSVTNNNVVVSDIASTQMLCEPERMAFDTLAPTTVQGQFKLTQNAKGELVLTVTSSNQINVFRPVITVSK